MLLLDCPELYDRAGIYYDARGDYRRQRRSLRVPVGGRDRLGIAASDEPFDIVHAHDWQGGLAPVYARTLRTSRTPAPAHGLHDPQPGVSGHLRQDAGCRGSGCAWQDFTINGFEFFDRLSFMKAGINFADAITTVSPTYAEEIQRPEYGNGLDGVIRARRDALVGILNGIDHDEWNPLADPFLPAPFDADSLEGKAAAKRALLETFGLHDHRRSAGAAGDRHGVAHGRSEGPRSDCRRGRRTGRRSTRRS